MEKLSVKKQAELKKMSSERLKQRLLKAGFEEEKLEDMSREDMLEALAEVWLKEEAEEEGAVGGAVEKVIEKPPGTMSMEMMMQWMMMKEEREEKRREEAERVRQEEKEMRQEELRLQREKEEKAERLQREKEEKAERLQREKEERRRQEEKEEKEKAELARKEELRLQREKEEKAEAFRQAELDLQKQQFELQMEQLKRDREDAERRNMEQMIAVERGRKEEMETRQQQVLDEISRQEQKERARQLELEQVEVTRKEDLKMHKENLEKLEAEKQERLKIEKTKLELKEAQLKEEKRVREVADERWRQEQELEKKKFIESETLIAKIKKIGDAMKHVLPKMPSDMMEVPLYFETVENAFNSFNVDRQFWVKLLLPLMTPKARTVLNRLSLADLDNYEKVKQHLLKEFKLTPREYRSKFVDAKKTAEETYTMFTARLKNLLNYYVRSRKVAKDYDKLFDLLVADKLKESLPPGPLQFVLSKEGTDCFEASNVADLADIHVNNRIGVTIPNRTNSDNRFNVQRFQRTPYLSGNQSREAQSGNVFAQDKREATTNRQVYNKTPPMYLKREVSASFPQSKRTEENSQRGVLVKRCHNCGSDQHFVKYCPVPVTTGNYRAKQDTTRVNRIQIVDASENLPSEHENQETEIKSVMKCGIQKETLLNPVVQKKTLEKEEDRMLKKVLLQYIDVEIRGTEGKEPVKVKALIDSGTEIPVISEELLEGMKVEQIGKVNLQCVTGDAIPAKLVKVDVRLCGKNKEEDSCSLTPYVTLMCASIPIFGSTERFLLHPEIIAELKSVPQVNIGQGKMQVNVTTRAQSQRKEVEETESEIETESSSDDENESVDHRLQQSIQDGVTSETNKQEMAACKNDNLNEMTKDNEGDVDVAELFKEGEKDEGIQLQIIDAKKFEEQQRKDETLKLWWKLAREKDSEFCVVNGLLHKRYQVLNQTIYQLVLPKERRIKVLELAHDSVFGGHLGEEKTKERIKLSFVWPKMRRDIVKFCKSCEKCQLKARSLVMDRVPITPIPREETAFKRITMDCIGPIEPVSTAGHKYCLCIVDSCTRWPTVFLLKSLTAKAVCDALMELFMNVGVPSVITSDQGTNFTANLTREYLNLMGCSPRFDTPGHPEAAGLVERWNQTFKKMIHHVIIDNPRRWHKIIPFAVWAVREVPNSTTGIAPYMLVYGKIPRGPLAILKESWTREIDLPPHVGIQPEKYLKEIKENMEEALLFAESYAREKQLQYTNQYNKRAKHKEFEPGEKVIVLYPTSTNKLISQWHGPCTIIERRSKYSYLIDMGEDGRRIIHANKIRKYITRTLNCGLIVEEDEDFGSVVELPLKSDSRDDDDHSLNLDAEQIGHLTSSQQKQLLEVLNKYCDRFSEKPGLCTLVEHEIVLKPEFLFTKFKNLWLIEFLSSIEQKSNDRSKKCCKRTLLNRHRAEWQVRW